MLEGGREGKMVSENEAEWPDPGSWLGALQLFTTGWLLVCFLVSAWWGHRSEHVISASDRHCHSGGH